MKRLMCLLAFLFVTPPLQAQVEMGERLRVRNAKAAPWAEGLLVTRDSAAMTLNDAGLERVYELAALEKVEWYKPSNLALNLAFAMAGGAAGGLINNTTCDSSKFKCRSMGTDLAIGGGVGLAIGALYTAISPGRWTNVTKEFSPAGATSE